jgi:protein-disulfide isomerase-like protein with CxxC motif
LEWKARTLCVGVSVRWRFGRPPAVAEIKSRENFRIVLVKIPMAATASVRRRPRKRRGVRADRRRVGRITGVLAGSVIDHALSRRYCLLSEDRSKTEPTTAILAKLFPAR